MTENEGSNASSMEECSITLHIDCSNGICIKALLAACWDATTSGNGEGNGVIELLADQSSRAFVDRLSTTTTTKATAISHSNNDGNGFVGETEILYLGTDRIVIQQPGRFRRGSGDDRSDDGRKEGEDFVTVCEEYANGSSEFWNSFPFWVAQTAREVLSEIILAASDGYEQLLHSGQEQQHNEECDIHVFLYYLIAILLRFDSMNLRKNVSYSPLPGRLCQYSKTVQKLLSGMIVDPSLKMGEMTPSSHSSIMSATFGVALLRVLSSGDISDRSRRLSVPPVAAPSMVMEKFGLGTSSQGLQLSIFLGKLQHHVPPNTIDDGRDPNNDAMPISSSTAHNNINNNNKKENGGVESMLWNVDSVTQLEANMDDTTGEHLAFVTELLMNHSALDAWVTPIVMKKGRPAYTLHCLCKGDDDDVILNELLELIFRHSTTLGVRIHRNIPRATLDRLFVTVATPFVGSTRKGLVDVKVSKFKSTAEIVSRKAEFEHCKEISLDTGVPVRLIAEDAVMRAVAVEKAPNNDR